MFDNEDNEIHYPMVEGYDYLIRRHEVLGIRPAKTGAWRAAGIVPRAAARRFAAG